MFLLPKFVIDLYKWLFAVIPYGKCMQGMRVGTRGKVLKEIVEEI